jgi:TolB protein
MIGRLFRPILFLIGLLALAGCVAPDKQPTHPTGEPANPPNGRTNQPAQWASQPTPVTIPTPSPIPRLTQVPAPASTRLPTPAPPTAIAAPFPWLLAYDSDVEGNDEIYLLPAGGGPAINLTQHPAEDRHPAWSPNGNRIAFQSNRDGNWEIYTLGLDDKRLTRLTFDLAYDGAPAWSPDGAWIAFESYRDSAPCQLKTPVPNSPPCPDLEIYRVPAHGGAPQRLTDSPQGDYQPVWSPDGAWIAFTSWRDGDKEVYVMPAGGGPARNVTASAGDDWSPVWSSDGSAVVFVSEREGAPELYRQSLDDSPAIQLTTDGLPKERPAGASDGSLLFARYDPGPAFEAHDPYRPGDYHLYQLSPNAARPQPLSSLKIHNPAVAPLADPGDLATSGIARKGQARVYPASSPPRLELRRMDDVEAPDPRLVAGVDDAFRAWRAAVHDRSGHDFLGQLSDVFRPARYYGHRLGYLSWHKAGRAVDLLFDWQDEKGQNALYIVREDIAGQIYWRLFLKCAAQDGSMGEPLTQAPWYFWWHPDPAKEPETFANGGRRLPIPAGYFVDVTALAQRYGWSRIASYQLEDFHWLRDSTATEYWHYQHSDGLTWYQAMAQIYSPDLLDELFSRPVAAAREQTEEVMDGKGLPPDATP